MIPLARRVGANLPIVRYVVPEPVEHVSKLRGPSIVVSALGVGNPKVPDPAGLRS